MQVELMSNEQPFSAPSALAEEKGKVSILQGVQEVVHYEKVAPKMFLRDIKVS